VQDAVDLALLEGLHGHSRAAALRLGGPAADFAVDLTAVDPRKPALATKLPTEVPALHRDPVDSWARGIAETILNDIDSRGELALVEHAIRLGDLKEGAPHVLDRAAMKAAYDSLSEADRGILDRTAQRIEAFAKCQKSSLQHEYGHAITGGEAGQNVSPVDVAGCYAPGGRYPLPSSVLMGAVTARVAGVKTVWVASPHPDPITIAAAYVAGADGLLAVGGAQAIGAFAYGAGEVPVCDAIVGPGNKFVTAAKSLVAGAVTIDMLAGPSECLVVADETADPKVVAADLLAQAEHDTAARAILVSTSQSVIDAVDAEIQAQLATLPTRETAAVAIEKNSFAVLVSSIEEAVDISDRLAPEHLEIHTADAEKVAGMMNHYGALFIGNNAAEVLGDYGAGPNHTLPTGGTARSYGGLSVHTFLRTRTWLRIDDPEAARVIVQDAVDLALLEGLHGHSRAAALRLGNPL
jgi:phosphoribosyl-ATP pyrophosphohydrolase/phosphoribosyl-AMP cyclohydrolase/histidinol dehydrogenase